MQDIEILQTNAVIRRVEARYALYADQKRWDEFAALFTTDGWFCALDEKGNEGFRAAGREDIAASLRARNSGEVQPIHQLFRHEIDIESPTSARAVWAMADLIVCGEAAVPDRDSDNTRLPFRTMRGWGHYHVMYRRVDGPLAHCGRGHFLETPMTPRENDRFRISIPQEVLDDLRARLRTTR